MYCLRPPPDEMKISLQEVGETKIYLAEVQTIVQALNLKYGIITRTDPLRSVWFYYFLNKTLL